MKYQYIACAVTTARSATRPPRTRNAATNENATPEQINASTVPVIAKNIVW